jgi:predicted N-acetyltransferase YhbS
MTVIASPIGTAPDAVGVRRRTRPVGVKTAIREFTAADIPDVADVHRRAFEIASTMTPQLLDEYARWLNEVFLESPTRTPGRQSLVYEDHGEIIGFLGVVARRVELDGRPYEASAGSNLVVLPERRGGTGSRIIAEFLARSGDLAIVDEVGDRALSLFNRLGMVAMPQSVRWTLPLSPLRHAVSLLGGHVPGSGAAQRVAGLLDGAVRRSEKSPFHYGPSRLVAEALSDDDLGRLLREFGSPETLRPVTSDGSTAWLLQRARAMRQHGELEMVALRDGDGPVIGWYVYYAKRGGAGEVIQLVAPRVWAGAVVDDLAHHALARGVVSLTGVMNLRFLAALSRHWATIAPHPNPRRYLLVHSTRPELLEAFWRNRVLLSRLDGEWCQHFR